MKLLFALFWMTFALAAPPVPGPPTINEAHHYNISWPTGLSLGEAQLSGSTQDGEYRFQLTMEASIPGFSIQLDTRSRATAALCSLESIKNFTRGRRKSDEQTTFDQAAGRATRTTSKGGGKTELQVASCAKDALAFLYEIRRELAAGRVPPEQTVYYGAPYKVKLDVVGVQAVRIGEKTEQADKLLLKVVGPASTNRAELYFAKDAARTPLLIKLPLTLGTFSMELAR